MLNTYDKGGGAEQVACDLFHAYRGAGHDAENVGALSVDNGS